MCYVTCDEPQVEPDHAQQTDDRRPSSRRDRERERERDKDKGADDRDKRARKELESAYRDVCTALSCSCARSIR